MVVYPSRRAPVYQSSLAEVWHLLFNSSCLKYLAISLAPDSPKEAEPLSGGHQKTLRRGGRDFPLKDETLADIELEWPIEVVHDARVIE